MGKQFAFCHGWTIDERKGFAEVTCRRRESCAYYSVTFYREHGDHLDDFEELFPLEPCPYFTERSVASGGKGGASGLLRIYEGIEIIKNWRIGELYEQSGLSEPATQKQGCR